jgi:uncharacterized membrane protein
MSRVTRLRLVGKCYLESTTEEANMNDRPQRGILIAAGALLGMGLGGFMDGIAFHNILQWHSMLSSVVVPNDVASMQENMFADGLFNAIMWSLFVVGIALLWRAGKDPKVPWSTRTFAGSLLFGWGALNVVEGLVNHHILGLHHVHPGPYQLAWDLAYLAIGVILAGIGSGLIRGGRRDMTPRGVRYVEIHERAPSPA